MKVFDQRSLILLCLCFVATDRCRAAAPEVRGTWLTTTGSENHIRTGANTAQVMRDLRLIGLNTAYVETWKNGYTNFPSLTLAAFTGGPDRSLFLGNNRDLVQETLIHAHRNQMVYTGWFEYGFAAQFIGATGTPSNPLAVTMRDNGWLLQDQQGRFGNASNGFAWMNPAVPEVREFLIDITLEAVERYDLDAIQFDDRLAWPREFGWDATTAALYLAETGNSLPGNVNNSAFRNWRQQKVTEFAVQLVDAVKTARPEIRVSVSPSITTFSEVNYNADWPNWVSNELFEEYAIQMYRDNLASFNSIVNAQVSPFQPDDLDKMIFGLRINGSGPDTPFSDVQAMIQRSRTEAAAGHSLWYSRGVRDAYAVQLANFYDVAGVGHADNPFYPSEWRPAPIVGAPVGNQRWSVQVEDAHRYRVVAEINGLWTEVNTLEFEAGSYQLHVPQATQVELLLDRRTLIPYLGDFTGDGQWTCADIDALTLAVASGQHLARFDLTGDGLVNQDDIFAWLAIAGERNLGPGLSYLPGDINLDGVVDGADFVLWNQRKFLPSGRWCEGDMNADGVIDGLDFVTWNNHKFQSSFDAMAVPESTFVWIMLCPATLLVRRRLL